MDWNRRKFMQMSAGLGLASVFSQLPEVSEVSFAEETDKKDGTELKITQIHVSAGASQPFRALHVSDTHLCFADERENERKRTLAADRIRYFRKGEAFFDAAMAHARKNEELFLHTGDLIDFVSEKNLETVAAKFQDAYCFVSAGNHEFSQYVGEAKEDAAYKAQSFDRVQRAFPNDLTFCSRVFNGINFIAIDDVYYNFTHEQLVRFQAEVEKGLPIVMLCHCPLYTPELFETAMSRPNAKCAYLVGVPEESRKFYEPARRNQQQPDAQTTEFIERLRKQPLLKAIFCGHLHYAWNGPFSKYAMQYVVGGNYLGEAYEIMFD